MDDALPGSSIARRLASCDKHVRDKALRSLGKWLASHPDVRDEELCWIWKGLFYCIWHADKQHIQVELINRVASFVVSLDNFIAIRYFEVFLSTMRREWSGIDFLRLDKFYLLIRRFLSHYFLLLKKKSWDFELSNKFAEILADKTLLVVDKYPAQGVNNHISEIFLEELTNFLPVPVEILDILIKPFLSVMEKLPDKVLLNKIKSNMFNCLLENGRILLDQKKKGNSNTQDEIANLGSIALKMGFAKKFFDLASSPDTVQGNRKFLFSLHEDYLKLEKDFEKLGIEVTELAGEVVADSNISSNQVEPYLENGSTLVYKASKKNKKNKKAPKDAVKDFGSDEKLGNGFIKSSEQVEQTLESCIDLAEGPSKKRKKVERASNGTSGKSKSKKNGLSGSATGKEPVLKNESEKVNNGDESYDSLTDSGHPITLDECVISNLQKQFEKAAADAGMDVILCPMPSGPVNGATSKKRKKAKNVVGMDEKQASVQQSDDEVEPEKGLEKSGDKSSKKVKFSMKNNLVWKPHNPLPPQSLRLPPSATPRGSALKKGIPPGPINETLAVKRKVKKKVCSVKKGMKTRKSVSASIKRLRKLQTLSV
ncbi:uncharacterized protein [Aristolochia californica]|uniref:uncharacterized protein isoform X1 n=1 Tax=Aristolochia californica TaxID=171875 RepID=UPI0035D8351C